MNQTTAIPFDDIRALVKSMPGPDLAAADGVERYGDKSPAGGGGDRFGKRSA